MSVAIITCTLEFTVFQRHWVWHFRCTQLHVATVSRSQRITDKWCIHHIQLCLVSHTMLHGSTTYQIVPALYRQLLTYICTCSYYLQTERGWEIFSSHLLWCGSDLTLMSPVTWCLLISDTKWSLFWGKLHIPLYIQCTGYTCTRNWSLIGSGW